MTRLKRKKEMTRPTTHQNDMRFGTPAMIAEYRAKRIAKMSPETIIEVGAGAGFQTALFSKRAAHVIAIDIDGERLARATFDSNVTTIVGDALDEKVIAKVRALVGKHTGKIVVFLDPARPASSERRTLAEIQPNIEKFLDAYREFSEDVAIELPPFLAKTELPNKCEREYLSVDGKLNRLTIYTGSLKRFDTSVVALPTEERVEYDGEPEDKKANRKRDIPENYLLVPDAALSQAGLVEFTLLAFSINITIDSPKKFGKTAAYFAQHRPKTSLFTVYKICAIGKTQSIRALAKCGRLILHGLMNQEEQRTIASSLRKHCTGDAAMHLFIGEEWILTTKA